MKYVLLCAVLLCCCCCCIEADAAPGIPIAGADVGLSYWNFPANDNVGTFLQVTLHPYDPASGPGSPTSLADLDDWAKANLGFDIPFEGDTSTVLRPLGMGVSECLQVGTVFKVPVRFGGGWVTGTGNGWGWFLKTDALSASF